ncbi:MAG: hypothetical protein SLRJCFUN_001250 [Candidatus Fervidibacter sp.]
MMPLDPTVIVTLAERGWQDAKRHRWFLVFAGIFAGLALMLSAAGFWGAGIGGLAGFGRTGVSLTNLVLFVIPLMGLLLGVLALVNEREQGTLWTLLAQPLTPAELLLGKWLGLAEAITVAVLLGFGISGLVIAFFATTEQLFGYLHLLVLTLLLGWANLSVGMLISTLSSRSSVAVSIALLLWLVSVWLADLGLMGVGIAFRFSSPQLLWLSLLNPAQIFRLAALFALQGNLELLGAAGSYAAEVFGKWLLPFLWSLLTLWVFVPLLFALWLFQRRWASGC